MNEVIAFRGILFGLFAAGIAGQIFWRHDADVGEGRKHVSGQQRYLPIMKGEPLPTILLSFFIIDAVMVGLREAIRFSMALCCTVFLQISLYYALLLPLLPVLRRYISARACGLLWLIPTYLYLTFNTGMWLPEPYWVIRIPGKAAAVLAGIWFMGFGVVMTRKIMEHLAFRRAVLQDARVVFDPAIRGV